MPTLRIGYNTKADSHVRASGHVTDHQLDGEVYSKRRFWVLCRCGRAGRRTVSRCTGSCLPPPATTTDQFTVYPGALTASLLLHVVRHLLVVDGLSSCIHVSVLHQVDSGMPGLPHTTRTVEGHVSS